MDETPQDESAPAVVLDTSPPPVEPEPAPDPPEPPQQTRAVAVEYSGLPDPETMEGRVWPAGRYQYLPEVLALRLVDADPRFRILAHPRPTVGLPGNALGR